MVERDYNLVESRLLSWFWRMALAIIALAALRENSYGKVPPALEVWE